MTGLPLLCVLISLPFVSATLIVLVPALHDLSDRHSRVTWPIGTIGLLLLLAGLVGLLPRSVDIPLMLAGGLVSGFSMFWSPRQESDGDGDEWRRWRPGPEKPPLGPLDRGPDWALFDILRTEWERAADPVPRRTSPGSDE